MQQRGCDNIRLLLSKYADGEATPSEMERVDAHVATCVDCSHRLTEFMEVSAIFHAEPTRAPEPQLRIGLFQRIARLKEEEQRRVRASRPWWFLASLRGQFRPARVFSNNSTTTRSKSAWLRAWEIASPFIAASMAVFAFLALTVFINRGPSNPAPNNNVSVWPLPVPTVASAIASNADNGQQSAPEATSKTGDVTLSPTSLRTTILPTAVLGEDQLLPLSQPRPVMEDGDVSRPETWHAVRDPAYGYSVSYPPNWWTQLAGSQRFFFPWGPGGTAQAPYWADFRVEDNPQGLTADTYNKHRLGGSGTVVKGSVGASARLRRVFSDDNNVYDELYSFDASSVYILRVSVPRESAGSDFTTRWKDADRIFSAMTGKVLLPAGPPHSLGYAPLLFLNGTDLSMVQPGSGQVVAVTHGYGVRQFALSPDMSTIAFTSAKAPNDLWGRSLYIVRLDDANSPLAPNTLWDVSAGIHDIAWYGDHELVAIAQTQQGGPGVYRIILPQQPGGSETVTRIASLTDSMLSARSLSVSPDRQLITFLAPLGERAGTDVYALRPDGSDLKKLLSHTDPLSVTPSGGRVYTPDGQALKSYVWASGHLEYEGYRYSMIFTCGDALSPTLYKGGLLFSTAGAAQGPMLNHELLGILDPNKMQVVHLALSADGEVALTGYYNDRDGRANELAGLWTADITDGVLTNIQSRPVPQAPHGIANLQWSADGKSLVYRETMPQSPESLSDRYDGLSPFNLMKLDLQTGQTSVLYSAGH